MAPIDELESYRGRQTAPTGIALGATHRLSGGLALNLRIALRFLSSGASAFMTSAIASSWSIRPGSDLSSQRILKARETAPIGMVLVRPADAAQGPAPAARAGSPWVDTFFNLGAADGAIHIEDMTQVAAFAMQDAGKLLSERLAAKGISASPPVDFSTNQAGKIEVAGHPQQAAIQAVLAQDPELEQTMRDALCLQEQAVSWQKAEQFQQAYGAVWEARGALAAAQMLGRFQTLGEPRTTLRFGPDGLQARFNGMSGERYVASVMRSLGVEPGLNLNAFA